MTWSDNTTSNVTTSSTWSENSSYASIISTGLAHDLGVVSNQAVTVSASYTFGGVTVNATYGVTIIDIKIPKSLAITGWQDVNETNSAQYTATVIWTDDTKSNVTNAASWSENSAYASISSTGLLTTLGVVSNQAVTVSASYTFGGVTVNATYGVTIIDIKIPKSLAITGFASVNGDSAQYTATVTWTDDTKSNVTNAASWSENSAYASISSTGLLTTLDVVSNQAVTVSASYTFGGVTVNATYDVRNYRQNSKISCYNRSRKCG